MICMDMERSPIAEMKLCGKCGKWFRGEEERGYKGVEMRCGGCRSLMESITRSWLKGVKENGKKGWREVEWWWRKLYHKWM